MSKFNISNRKFPIMRHTSRTSLRNAIIMAAWQLARSAHSTVEWRRGLFTSLLVNVDVYRHSCDIAWTSVKVRESNSLMYSGPQDTDAPCRRKGSDSPTTGQPLCNSHDYTRLTSIPSDVFSNHASNGLADRISIVALHFKNNYFSSDA